MLTQPKIFSINTGHKIGIPIPETTPKPEPVTRYYVTEDGTYYVAITPLPDGKRKEEWLNIATGKKTIQIKQKNEI